MRNALPDTGIADGLERLLAEMRAAIAGVQRPPALVEAEERLREARDHRANCWHEFQRLASLNAKDISRRHDGEVLAAKANVAEADKWIRNRQRAVDELRDQHADVLQHTLDRFRKVAAVAAHGAAVIIEETNRAAAREHRKLPPAVEYAPALQALVTDAQRAAYEKSRRDDGALDRALAALSQRRAVADAKDPAAPTRGKIAIDRLYGNGTVSPDEPQSVRFRVDHTTGAAVPMAPPPNLVPGRMTVGMLQEAASAILGRRRS